MSHALHHLIIALLVCSCRAFAQDPSASQPTTRTGRIFVEYPFPPLKDYNKLIGPIAKAYGLPIPGKTYDELRAFELSPDGRVSSGRFDPTGVLPPPESAKYTLYIPESYEADDRPFGLMVWIAPQAGAGMRPQWREVLDKHRIIFIAPHDVPNESHSVWRVFMALESVRNATASYNIDPDRVYVAGLSGGGRISSHTVVFFPDVFSGAFCMVGCNFYSDVPAGNRQVYPGFWPRPDMRLVAKGRANSRLALLTGSNDFNLPSTKAAYEAYLKDKWAHVTYLEVPGMGHEFPDAEWFEKGVIALDEPLGELAKSQYQRALQYEKQRKLGDACLAFETAARHGGSASFVPEAADKAKEIRGRYSGQLDAIEKLIDEKKFDQASALVRQLKTDFGPMSAEKSQELFEQIREARKSGG